jgi:tRNA (cmo5U34)-methyltransferase
MSRIKSAWEIEENAKEFLEFERAAVPGADMQFSVIGKIAQIWCDNPARILDLGCGDGVLGRFLLRSFPGASGVFIDFSDPMLDAARENLGSTPGTDILKADFSSPKWLDSVSTHKPFDIVISGFAVHHQPDERKKEIYSEIYSILSPGGIFLNLEHVSSRTPEVERLFEEYYIDHLHDFHSSSNSATKKEEVAEGYNNRPDKDEDQLADVGEQCGWLTEIGFRDVDCFFKLFEMALFGGRK